MKFQHPLLSSSIFPKILIRVTFVILAAGIFATSFIGLLRWPIIDRAVAQSANPPFELAAIGLAEEDPTMSLVWGDYDNDGDLDLAVGNGSAVILDNTFPPQFEILSNTNRIYRNNGVENGRMPDFDLVWSSPPDEIEPTASLAWGDYDFDGDLDLAIGNYGRPNQIYRNDGLAEDGTPKFELVWNSLDNSYTVSVAWADVNGDEKLDLAVGNGQLIINPSSLKINYVGHLNQLYQFENFEADGRPKFDVAAWSSDVEPTASVAWGDYNNDDLPDLAVGNWGHNRVYENVGGVLTSTSIWTSTDTSLTTSIAWGNVNNDEFLDLAAGNGGFSDQISIPNSTADLIIGQPNHIYLNLEGTSLSQTPVWTSTERDVTTDVAWGDYDSDGNLDLMAANVSSSSGEAGAPDRLYRNDDNDYLSLSAVWSTEQNVTSDIAWGDYNNDGNLDLATGGANFPAGALNLIYDNLNGGFRQTWQSEEKRTNSVAWGDVDGDGDLDLAVGNEGEANQIYCNQDGILTSTSVWTSTEEEATRGLAWGDMDGNGRLELAVGNYNQPNRIYSFDVQGDCLLTATTVWTSSEAEATSSVAWADIQADGNLELAVGNQNQKNRVYHFQQDGSVTQSTTVWISSDSEWTLALAWGDMDGDGDPDLAVGNDGPNRVYRNLGGGLLTSTSVWTSTVSEDTTSLAWGDVEGDGDLDLAAGNYSTPNKLYQNKNGSLTTTKEIPGGSNLTQSIAWGDMDGDGDLDLAVGNGGGAPPGPFGAPNQIFRNDGGELRVDPVWSSSDQEVTVSVAWGDMDGDSDLDLAVGNWVAVNNIPPVNRVYKNVRRSPISKINSPPYAVISRPDNTPDADFFSTGRILTQTNLLIPYKLFDPEEDTVLKIIPEFSPNGGGQWFPATPGTGGSGVEALTASPEGESYTFAWNVEAEENLIQSDNVQFRIRAVPNYRYSPILWPALDDKSAKFRLASPFYIRVVHENGTPIKAAEVYADGKLLGLTNDAGLLRPTGITPGTELVALAQQSVYSTTRAAHDGWSYRTYITNMDVLSDGTVVPFTVTGLVGEQRLIVKPKLPLFAFNIVVSVEWDATEAYLEDVKLAFDRAAAFLYDVTDGQMTFAQVTIYDNAKHWADADIQILTKNNVTPHATINGLKGIGADNNIRVGRFWDGDFADQGAWSEPPGFRTLIHEFGHYGLGLYDEYISRVEENGQVAGERDAYCTHQWFDIDENGKIIVINEPDDENGASIMDDHYRTGEFADTGRWTIDCQQTEQARINKEADWKTIIRYYSDSAGRWELVSPDDRAGMGLPVPGPTPASLEATLPFPNITFTNEEPSPEKFTVQVCRQTTPLHEAWVTLYPDQEDKSPMDQGYTNPDGQIEILGAEPGDELQVVYLQEGLAKKVDISLPMDPVILGQETTSSILYKAEQTEPGLKLQPTTSNGQLDGLLVIVKNTLPEDNLFYGVTDIDNDDSGAGGFLQANDYDETNQEFRRTVNFIPASQAGYARVFGMHDNNKSVDLNVDYRLHQATNISDTILFSNDGNLKLNIVADALPFSDLHFLVASPWNLPAAPPPGWDVVGEAYEISASGSVAQLLKPNVLTLRYDDTEEFDVDSLTIYHWDNSVGWQPIGGDINKLHQEVTTTTQKLGLYALMGQPKEPQNLAIATGVCGAPPTFPVYLPFIVKN